MNLNVLVKKRRIEQKISMQKISEIAGVSRQSIATYEQGRTILNGHSLVKILIFLGISVASLPHDKKKRNARK